MAVAAVFLPFSCASADLAKKYPNMVADADPVSAGSVEIEFDRLFSSKLNKIEVEVIFYPRLNETALEFRHDFIRYRLFWDLASRKHFIIAVNQYIKDFAAQVLDTKYRKTRSIYGKVKGRLEWESFKIAQTHKARPIIEIGYRFKGKTPFFAMAMRSAKDESAGAYEKGTNDSQQVSMYLTRAQGEGLAKLFDQQYLLGLLEIKEKPNDEKTLVVDEYIEYND